MASATNTRLSQRYGSRRTRPRRKAVLWLVAVLVVVGLGFLLWAAFGKDPQADSKMIGFAVVDSTRTNVDFSVTKDSDRQAKCEVRALDESFAVVGWKIVDVPPASDGAKTTVIKTPLNTDSLAVSADVQTCWVG